MTFWDQRQKLNRSAENKKNNTVSQISRRQSETNNK